MTHRDRVPNLWRQWLAAGALTSILAVAGRGALETPPLLHPVDFLRWWSARDPVVVAMALLRVVGFATGCYWLVLCAVAALARWTGRIAWLGHARVPGLARVAKNAAGISVMGAAMAGVAGCGLVAGPHPADRRPPAPPVLVPIPTTAPPGNPDEPSPPASVVPPADPALVTAPPAPAPTRTPAPARTPASSDWVVKPGDDLWSIAESVLADRLGQAPGERAIAELWLRIIEANRAHLPDPANPNLIFAGDVVAIPG